MELNSRPVASLRAAGASGEVIKIVVGLTSSSYSAGYEAGWEDGRQEAYETGYEEGHEAVAR